MTTRIDTISDLTGREGQPVVLRFEGDPDLGNATYVEAAIFVRLTGDGEEARATFRSPGTYPGETYEWEAYRFEGRWAYGTGADALTLVSA